MLRTRILTLSLALGLLLPAPSWAQATTRTRPLPAAQDTTAAQEAGAQAPRPLTLDDYGQWSTINQVALSPDGRWATFSYAPNDGDSRLFLRDLNNLEVDPLELAVNGSGPVFSDDGKWLGFITSPPSASGRGGGRGGAPPGAALRRSGPGSEPHPHLPPGGASLRCPLSTGSLRARAPHHREPLHLHLRQGLPLARGPEGPGGWRRWARRPAAAGRVALRGKRREAEGGAGAASSQETARGSDLILMDLGSGTLTNLGNVAEFAFNEPSTHFAYVVDAEDRAGNGLHVMELAGMRIIPLNTGPVLYQGMTWNEDGNSLAVLRGEKADSLVQRENELLTFVDVTNSRMGAERPAPAIYDPAVDPDFPEGFVLSEFRTPSWSDDGRRVFVGIKEQEQVLDPEDEVEANVDVWHWLDKRVQSEQEVQASRDRRATYLGVLNLEGPRFFRLSDETMERVQLTDDGRWAIGFDDSPYWMDWNHADNRSDVYRVDPTTGYVTQIAEALVHSMGTSPDSQWFLYWQDQKVQAYNLESQQTVDLTARSGGVDFENKEYDMPVEKPAYGVGGWSTDGGVVFLNDRFDVWQVPLEDGEAVNLTGGMGAREEIQFRIMDLDTEDEGVDTSRPIFLSAYGEWTKKSGYFQARPGRDPQELLFQDAQFSTAGFRGSGLRKAEDADRVIYTRQTFQEFPDYWVADTRFRNPRRFTDANPQQSEFLWGSRVLVDYTDQRGNKLQATLTLPAGYTEGERYPMIIYFYEKMSQRHNEYSQPVYDDRPHMSTYASNGYLVLMPDIIYDTGYPGSSALDDVTSAARAVIDQGYAQADRICLQGHSWGGYETSFILTQTDMFACIVTGAPLTNLVSMHNILYKQSGSPNAPIIEWSQGRMGVSPYEDLERYVAESAVHHVENITTPFLILQGTADGAVDWNQGLELYISARRTGKEVIFLSYPGEPHHLAKEENQKDFQIRMKEFFDYYLKDAPAPTWMT